MKISHLFGSALAAFAVSWLVVRWILRHAERLNLIDKPNARSTHRNPTPQGGGVGILGGLAAGLCVLAGLRQQGFGASTLALLVAALAIGGMGLMDDRRPLPAGLRLLTQMVAAGGLVAVAGPIPSLPLPGFLGTPFSSDWVAIPFTILWLTAMTNFFNFMDGVDGLAGGQAVVSCLGVMLAGFSPDGAGVAAAMGGASAGFLLHNWPPARIFMGDVGSGSIGFVLAGLPLLAPPERRSAALFAIAVGMTFFILDPVLTLLRRAAQRKPLMQAHREHLYQRLIPAGTSSEKVTSCLLGGAAILSLLGALVFRQGRLWWIAALAAIVLFSIELVFASRA